MSARVEVAVQAFADVERVQRLLERKQRELSERVVMLAAEDVPEYFARTEALLREAEQKAGA